MRHYYSRELEDSSRAELQERSWAGFLRQWEHAWETPFYREYFGAAGLSVESVVKPDDIAVVPFSRKRQLIDDQLAEPPFGTRIRMPRTDISNIVETSGTSGRGKETHAFCAADYTSLIGMEEIGFTWAGVTAGTFVALTLPVGMGAAGAWWLRALEGLGACVLKLGQLSTADKVRYLDRYHPEILVATPSYVTRLEEAARSLELDPALLGVRSIIMAGERRSASWFALRQQVWQATVYEQWGTSAGAVAWCCEQGVLRSSGQLGILHVPPEHVFFEVVDPATGRHVEPGEVGELVVTPLNRAATPLIRFATGDQVKFMTAESCECGRKYDGIEVSSVTRMDDMIKVKGINLWPAMVDDVVSRYHEITDYVVLIRTGEGGKEEISIEAAVAPDKSSSEHQLIDALARELRDVTGIGFVVTCSGDMISAARAGGTDTGKVARWLDVRV